MSVKGLQNRIIAQIIVTVFLASVTLMVNGVGVVKSPITLQEEEESLCRGIRLDRWYLYITATFAISLVISIARYLKFK